MTPTIVISPGAMIGGPIGQVVARLAESARAPGHPARVVVLADQAVGRVDAPR